MELTCPAGTSSDPGAMMMADCFEVEVKIEMPEEEFEEEFEVEAEE